MSKIMCFLVFAISFFSVHAQDQQIGDVSLASMGKVDSLEHELAFFRLDYDMKTLIYDITMFADEVSTKSLDVELKIYTQNFDYRLRDSYSQYYVSCQNKKLSMSKLVEKKKIYFYAKVTTYPYTDRELEVLMASYQVIDAAWESLERSMDLLKLVTDHYDDSM